jgi:aryl-alcohol dehydrogenase-like predicted oxidoreductase
MSSSLTPAEPAIRLLGSTGLSVTALGLGLAALGRPGYLNLGHREDLGRERSPAALERHAHEVLDCAWAAEWRYFDAARSYGLAERFLAHWLAARPERAEQATVGSKWGYTYTADWRDDADVHEVKDHSLAQLRRQLAETQAELGGLLDLYQVHSATLDSGVLDDRAVLAALTALADSGVVVGLSTSGPEQAATIRRALAVEVDGRNPFRCVQATWNVLEPSAGAALAEAATAGWGVIVKEAVANGRLTPRGDAGSTGAVAELARERGVGADALALAAALAQPGVHMVLSGAATCAQVQSNHRALTIELGDDERAALAVLAEDPDAYWQRRSAQPWT